MKVILLFFVLIGFLFIPTASSLSPPSTMIGSSLYDGFYVEYKSVFDVKPSNSISESKIKQYLENAKSSFFIGDNRFEIIKTNGYDITMKVVSIIDGKEYYPYIQTNTGSQLANFIPPYLVSIDSSEGDSIKTVFHDIPILKFLDTRTIDIDGIPTETIIFAGSTTDSLDGKTIDILMLHTYDKKTGFTISGFIVVEENSQILGSVGYIVSKMGNVSTEFGGYPSWDTYCKAKYGDDQIYDSKSDECITEKDPIDNLLDTATDYFDQEKWVEADQIIDQVLKLNPNHLDALGVKAITLFELQRYYEISSYVDRSLAIEPNDQNMLKWKETVEDYEKAKSRGNLFSGDVKIVPSNAYVNNEYGFSLILPNNMKIRVSEDTDTIVEFSSPNYDVYVYNLQDVLFEDHTVHDLRFFTDQRLEQVLTESYIAGGDTVVSIDVKSFADGYKIKEVVKFDHIDDNDITISYTFALDSGDNFSIVTDYPDKFYYDEFDKIADSFYMGPIDVVTTNVLTQKVPDWVKNNAKWWAEGTIGDDDFIGGLQHLIKEEIITVPRQTAVSTTSNEIPSWVKTQTEWWANGVITEEEFLNSIEYLMKQGIINLGDSSSQTVNELQNIDKLISQGQKLLDEKKFEQSIPISNEILTIDPTNYHGLQIKSYSLMSLQRESEAVPITRTALEIYPDDCELMMIAMYSEIFGGSLKDGLMYGEKAKDMCQDSDWHWKLNEVIGQVKRILK